MTDKKYIGDGVYVALDSQTGQTVLTTEDGIRVTNTIYLDEEIFAELEEWRAEMRDPSHP